MRVLKRNPWLTGLGTVLSLLILSWGRADAQIPTANQRATTDNTASVLVFPKVIADGTRDTVIQITNTSPMPNLVHCEYINATGNCRLSGGICDSDLDCPGTGPCDNISCQAHDFSIYLTRQQPTIWRVSTGRLQSLGQTLVTPEVDCELSGVSQVCPGLEPLLIIPQTGFRGELRCYEIDASGCLISQNALKGEAIIETLGTAQIAEYNAIGLPLVGDAPTCTDPETLSLGWDPASGRTQYVSCPVSMDLNHYAQGADDIVARNVAGASCPAAGDCPVSTDITMVPCSVNYLSTIGATTSVHFSITNEFEQPFSADATFSCWFNRRLDQINPTAFSHPFVGSELLKTRITPQGGYCVGGGRDGLPCSQATGSRGCDGGQCRPNPGILAVAESSHSSAVVGAPPGAAAVNLIFIGSRGAFDDQSGSGGCRISHIDCTQNGDADCCSDAFNLGNPSCAYASGTPDPLDLCPSDTIVLPKPVP